MKLSISNIAWPKEADEEIYLCMKQLGFEGLEIAPTRLFPEDPYSHLKEAKAFQEQMQSVYGLSICSMQSIWYGVTDMIFGTKQERKRLLELTFRAIDFAQQLACKNLVFGCPKNRNRPEAALLEIAIEFFYQLGEYAKKKNTIVAIEPNPPIYLTNFINTTEEAFAFCEQVASDGLKVNVDLGTCIYYGEPIRCLNEHMDKVNHIHISEPMLAPLVERSIHKELKDLDYQRFVSIEMKNTGDLGLVKDKMRYIKEILA